jgi:IS30 family transposase
VRIVVARKLTVAERAQIMELWAAGLPVRLIGREAGVAYSTVRGYVKVLARPTPPARTRSPLRLSLAEREDISRGLAGGESLRAIAALLGRAPSTISREVRVNGGRRRYRAVRADEAAWKRRCGRRSRSSSGQSC